MDDLKASRLAEAIQDSGIIFHVVTVLGKKEYEGCSLIHVICLITFPIWRKVNLP